MASDYNLLLATDSYKLGHRQQYPEGLEYLYSNFTPRYSMVEGRDRIIFFGLQYFLKRYMDKLNADIAFCQDGMAKIDGRPAIDVICEKYEASVTAYLGPNEVGSSHIRALFKLGYVPLEFRAVPEGSDVPIGVPVLTVENTHPKFAWLVNYFETLLSASLWHMCSSATTSYYFRLLFEQYAELTGADPTFIDFQGHDFSFRGLEGLDAAAASGSGHLVSFKGSDTLPTVEFVKKYYGKGLPEDHLIAASVPASEHSVQCAFNNDFEYVENIVDNYDSGIVSVVMDGYDYWNVITEVVPSLKEKILAKDGFKLVCRPDSGDPEFIVCGDPSAPEGSPEYKGTVECLWETFGGTVTDKGYKVLDEHIGVIYGDSINYERASNILRRLEEKGFASSNIVFGIGSFTFQYVTRDTYGWAMKATWCQIDGEEIEIFKDPKTGDGKKKSLKGRINVVWSDEARSLVAHDQIPKGEEEGVLYPIWRDGRWLQEENFEHIRGRVQDIIQWDLSLQPPLLPHDHSPQLFGLS